MEIIYIFFFFYDLADVLRLTGLFVQDPLLALFVSWA